MNPFANWTQTQVDEHNRRLSGKPAEQSASGGVEIESELHGDIMDYCRMRGWQYFHGSMAHKSMRTLGEPDFTILSDRGRVFFVECKRKGGKLSPQQQALAFAAERLGHKIHVVRSMTEFYEITK